MNASIIMGGSLLLVLGVPGEAEGGYGKLKGTWEEPSSVMHHVIRPFELGGMPPSKNVSPNDGGQAVQMRLHQGLRYCRKWTALKEQRRNRSFRSAEPSA